MKDRSYIYSLLQKKKEGRRKRELALSDTSSIADVAFLLLIFFIVTSSFIVSQGLHLRLPSPGKSQKVAESRLVTIYPQDTGYRVKGVLLDEPALGEVLDKRFKADKSVICLIIMGKSIQYHRLIETLDMVKKTGISKVSVKSK
jgi:biopolymer transport protein ExbD